MALIGRVCANVPPLRLGKAKEMCNHTVLHVRNSHRRALQLPERACRRVALFAFGVKRGRDSEPVYSIGEVAGKRHNRACLRSVSCGGWKNV